MKILIDYLDNKINKSNDEVLILEILNKKLFYRTLKNFNDLILNNFNDEIVICDEDDNELTKIKMIINYVNLEVENRKQNNDIVKYINNNLEELYKLKIVREFRIIQRLYKKIVSDIDVSLKVNEDIDISTITKMMQITINYKYDLIDNLLLLIDLESTLKLGNILIFVNLKEYIEDSELIELYKYSIYNNVHIILLESQKHTKLEYENKYIIDEELDEFNIKNIE